jgi:hypothetical protein
MSKLVRKFEEKKKELWAKRLGLRKKYAPSTASGKHDACQPTTATPWGQKAEEGEEGENTQLGRHARCGRYVDNKFLRSRGRDKVREMRQLLEKWMAASCTLYVGNLSFGHPVYGSTTEEQLYDLFGRCGDVKRVVMGLDRNTREPCGFAFVEFYAREAAVSALASASLGVTGRAVRHRRQAACLTRLTG